MPRSRIDSLTAILFILLLFAPGKADCDVYSWVDAQGVRHFSNTTVDSSGNKPKVTSEFVLTEEERQRIERESAEKAAAEIDRQKADAENRIRKNAEDQEAAQARQKTDDERKILKEKEKQKSQALQTKCNTSKERLSTLRFTGLNKYTSVEVERYAADWSASQRQNRSPKGNPQWRQQRDEDVQKYKKSKYEQELKEAEQEVDAYCKN